VPTAAKPAATAASLATRFRVEVLGRTDFFDFAGRLAFVVLLVFDLAPARFKLVFDLTRRFDEVLFVALLCLFHDSPHWIQLSSDWASIRMHGIDFLPLYGCQNGGSSREKGEKISAQEELKQAARQVLWLGL
jgi:hypothetical protein